MQLFITELIQTGFRTSAKEFKQEVMACLNRLIRFDMALWASGHTKDLQVNNTCLHNLPDTMMHSWEQVKHQDRLLAGLIANPGVTFDVYDFYTRQERKNLEAYQQHSKLFGIENAISTAIPNPDTGLLEVMSLYRRDPEKNFSPDEQKAKQFVFPLMIETWHHNQIQHLGNLSQNSIAGSLAICDRKAWIHHAEPRFIDLLKSQWPGWSGPEVPEPVKTWLEGVETKTLKEKKIVFSRMDLNDMILIQANLIGSMALLTEREEQVAEFFAGGLTYKGIARELSLSPFTVRRHIESIYKKLEVSSKVELFQMLNPLLTRLVGRPDP